MESAPITRNNLSEAVDLFSGTTVAGVLYTFVAVLYCLMFYSERRSLSEILRLRRRVAVFILISFMMLCATMDVTLLNIQRRITFVDYNTLPGGPLGLAASFHALTIMKLLLVTRLIEKLLITWLMVWRVILIWDGFPLARPIALFLYASNTGLAITELVMEWLGSGPLVAAVAPSRVARRMFIASSTFDTGFLVTMTLMLVIRLLSLRRQQAQILGAPRVGDRYLSIVAIFIQSYVLEAAWNIAFCIFCSLKYVPVDKFFNATLTQVDILTNFLVIYRILLESAWDRQMPDSLSSLHWDHDDTTAVGKTIKMGRLHVV